MPTRFSPLAALLLLSGSALGQERVFVWEATSDSGHSAYLMGSIHLAKPEFYPLDASIYEAYDSADSLVVEVNLSKEEEAAMGMVMMQAGIFMDGRKLSDVLKPETAETFGSYLDERGLPRARFETMKPWMAAMMVSITEMMRLGYKPEHGIDKHFVDRANEGGKPIEQLETAEFQIELLSGFSEELQDAFLRKTIEDSDQIPEMIDSMTSAWKSGEGEPLEEMLLAPSDEPEMQAVMKAMIDDRNYAMADKIVAMMEAGTTPFVVVGSGHIVGPTGLVKLLGERGYTLRQLEAAPAAAGAAAR